MATYDIVVYIDNLTPASLTPTEGSVIGKYDIYYTDTLIGKYNVNQNNSLVGLYTVSLTASATGKYDILPRHSFNSTWSNYVIEIFDPILTEGQFNNLKIRKRISQIPIATFDVINPSATIISQLIYNAPIRIRINGRLLFTGILKRIEKDDNVNVYHLMCEGGGCILRDINIPDTTVYENYGSYYIIEDLLLPATNWTPIISGWHYIDYTVTPGPALNHIENICKLEGFDWDVRQQNTTRAISSYVATASQITVDGATITPDDYYWGRYGAYVNGSSANTGFSITDQTGNVLTVSTIPTSVATGDQVILWGKYHFYANKPSTTSATVAHYVINKNACRLNRKKNVDKIVTSVVGVAQNPEIARSVSWATSCTLNFATIDVIESYLSQNVVDDTDTWLWIKNTSGYPDNGRIQIGDEKIDYTNKSATGFGPCTRGADSTTATIHYINDDVLNITQLKFDSIPDTFPATGSFWIGTERIEYATYTTPYFYTLTRGYAGSNKYRHTDGAIAFDAQYTETSPESGSPVGLYGVQKYRLDVIGATNQDSLDKHIQGVLMSNDDLIEYGDFTLLSADYWYDINLGDRIKFTDKSGTDNYWTIIGTDHEQYKPLIIYFGVPEENILEDFARIDIVSDYAKEKNENARIATVTATNSDGKMVQVVYEDNGSTGWVRIP